MSQLIVSYYTQGAYAKEADRLRRSLDRLDLAYTLEEIPPFSHWSDAVRYKPRFLAEMRKDHPESDLLFVDADAVVWQDPWPYINKIEHCDMAVCRICPLNNSCNYILSGTIYLPANGQRTNELLDAWIQVDTKEPDLVQPQRVLQRVIDTGDFSIAPLEPRLCWIFDRTPEMYGWMPAPGPVDPIIEHLQASRNHRKPELSDPAARERRRDRIRKVEEALAC